MGKTEVRVASCGSSGFAGEEGKEWTFLSSSETGEVDAESGGEGVREGDMSAASGGVILRIKFLPFENLENQLAVSTGNE